ncbi:MAG: TIGR01777 family oxidoreductase [Bdellovibrionales bacterium]|nr:TIGR01777 family oxidoreductase [Bdellovibrionales bacterium]
MKILVTGGTGFLGTPLIEELLRRGHQVLLVTRKSSAEIEPNPCQIMSWPPRSEANEKAILGCDAVINLAGESLASGRWNNAKKQRIRNSRIQLTTDLVDILRSSTKLHTFLSASAIGFYGDRKTEVLTESSHVGAGFLAEVCRDWEQAALALKRENLRTVLLRTGVVLGRNGGIIGELEPLFKMHVGGPVGYGEQHLSWIHIQDWVRAVLFCLENPSVTGAVNLVSPEPVTNASFSSVLSELMRKPMQLPAPAIALKLSLGEMSALALDSQNVRPEKLLQNNFKFLFSYLREALKDIYDYEAQNHEIYEYFESSAWLPRSPDEVFRFFSDARNLQKITPPEMGFVVEKMSTSEIVQGSLIDYKLKVHGIPIQWRTEIIQWAPPKAFVDNQLKGPYSRWHHTHTFEPLAGGTLMKDRVHYKLPLGCIGRLFGLALVKKDVRHIFSYREKIIREIFFL